ncbi:O-antigen polymerase [Streptococcus parauberis]|uniref:O-antigen polymerase n=1 Tax=Streptococcus parauberis TaxID=1348 RepID=UPI0037B6A79E
MVFLLIMIFLIVIYFSTKWYENIFNPVTVFIGINILSLILMFGLSGLNDKLSLNIWGIIFTMFVSYIIGIFLGSFKYKLSSKNKNFIKTSSRNNLKILIIVYSILFDISAFYYLYKIIETFGLVGILSKLTEMNIAFQSGEFNVGIFSLFLPICYALSIMILYYIKFYKTHFSLYIQYLLCYIPAISPRRDTLFYLVFMSIAFVLLTTKKSTSNEDLKKYFKIFTVGSVVIWFMGVSQNLLNKASNDSFKLFQIPIPSFLNEIVIYIAGNYPYLQKMNDLGKLQYEGFLVSTFRLLNIYIYPIFGGSPNTRGIFELQLINIGDGFNFLFNTIPMVYYFIKESGMFFFIGFIVLGFLCQKFYMRYKETMSLGNLLILTYICFLLVFSFRSYNIIYLSTFMILVYMLLAYFIIDVERDIQ